MKYLLASNRFWVASISIAIGLTSSAFGIELSPQQLALKDIEKFSDSICTHIPLDTTTTNVELNGKAKAELNGIVKKLAGLGLSGATNYKNEKSQNVLQKDLAAIVKQNIECRERIANKLIDKMISPIPISPNTQKVQLQHASYILASGNCADAKNTDKEGYNNPVCTWFKKDLPPQLANSELHISLKLVVDLNKICGDPHRRAEVFLAYGETREERSGLLGCNNCNQITQEYSLSGMIKTFGNKSVPVKVFINPRGCTEATLKSGELSYTEVQP